MKSVRIYQYSFIFGLMLSVILSCSESKQNKTPNITDYSQESSGTRRLEWDDNQGIGWIKILLEAANFGVQGIEVAEMYFPPGYQDVAHMHELVIEQVYRNYDGPEHHPWNNQKVFPYPILNCPEVQFYFLVFGWAVVLY